MRLLLVPRLEGFGGRGSLTIPVMNFVRFVLEADPHARVDIAHQHADDPGWPKKYVPEGWPHINRIRAISLTAHSKHVDARKVGYFIGAPLLTYLKPGGKRVFYDAVISNAFASNPMIKAWMCWDWSRAVKRSMPLVGWSVWSATDMWKNESSGPWDNLAELTGSLSCDLLVFESEKVKRDHIDSYRKYFKAMTVADIMKRSIVAANGADVQSIAPKKFNGKEPQNALWSGYWREDGKLVSQILIDAYRLGKLKSVTFQPYDDIPAWLTEEIDKNEGLRRAPVMSHDDFIKFVSDFDVFLSFVSGPERTYGIRFAEMMAGGQLPVCHSETALTFLPKSYPYHTDKAAELKAVFFAALNNQKEQPSIIDQVLGSLRDLHDSRRNMLFMYDSIKTLVNERMSGSYGSYGPAVEKAMKGVEEINHDDACALISELTNSKESLLKNPFFPPGAIRWAIMNCGFEDVGGVVPYYRRPR